MQSLYLEPSGDMALNDSDRAWIREAIREAIKESYQQKGLGRISRVVREWSLSGVAGAFLIFALTQWSGYTEFRIHTQDRLDRIEADMRLLRAPIEPREILKEMSQLSPNEFAQSLPALRKAQEQPVSDVRPLTPYLRTIAQKLQHTDPQTPEYWPTVIRFLHFATAGISTAVPPPGPPTVASQGGLEDLHLKGIRVLLDGGSMVNVTIENSRVTFTENPVRMTNVQFVNCVFDLPVVEAPNKYLKDAARVMLASSLESIRFDNLS